VRSGLADAHVESALQTAHKTPENVGIPGPLRRATADTNSEVGEVAGITGTIGTTADLEVQGVVIAAAHTAGVRCTRRTAARILPLINIAAQVVHTGITSDRRLASCQLRHSQYRSCATVPVAGAIAIRGMVRVSVWVTASAESAVRGADCVPLTLCRIRVVGECVQTSANLSTQSFAHACAVSVGITPINVHYGIVQGYRGWRPACAWGKGRVPSAGERLGCKRRVGAEPSLILPLRDFRTVVQ